MRLTFSGLSRNSTISSKSEALEAQTGRQFVVVTVNSLDGQDSATYTRDLGNYWRIGRKGYNDGVILLVAPNERKIWIAVGDGLATVLPNAQAQQIVDELMLPYFRTDRMPEGITAGADALVHQLSLPPAHQLGTRLRDHAEVR
jgi:uncharacterized protein